jgi:hypothetical protein
MKEIKHGFVHPIILTKDQSLNNKFGMAIPQAFLE